MIQVETFFENRQKQRENTFCKNKERSRACVIPSVSEAGHVAVSLQRSQQDVEEPEGEEHQEGEELGCPWAPELSTWDAGTAAVEQHKHTQQRHDGEEGDRKGQGAWVHLEHFAFGVPVNGCDGPRHTDAQKHIHCIAAGHVANGGVSVLVLDSSHFTCKSICQRIRHRTSDTKWCAQGAELSLDPS